MGGAGALTLLFVYGSLRRGGAAHGLLEGSEEVGAARYQGRLYDLGAYPGAVPSGDAADVVHGEVRRLPAARLEGLDRFEGPEYSRERVCVRLAAGGVRECWIYLYRGELRGRARVASGDWERGGDVS